MTVARTAAATLLAVTAGVVCIRAQQTSVPQTLIVLADTERAFAARATVVGWKQAFLEYFADDAVGFDGDKAVPAKGQLQQVPDPPKDVQLLWEPRYGDVAASGDIGWLTGPSTTIVPARNNGAPRYGNYASVWKRQADGSYKVLLDVGINTPMAAPFAAGFTRVPLGSRFEGTDTVEMAAAALRQADTALNDAARMSQESAYKGRLWEGARLHRTGNMPVTGEPAILGWLRAQPAYASGSTRFVEVARSRELGYTYGTYAYAAAATPPPAPAPADPAGARGPEKGFYTRVWTRGRNGAWQVVLDVLQPQ
jgi:ketosteroid isomerase-like protein